MLKLLKKILIYFELLPPPVINEGYIIYGDSNLVSIGKNTSFGGNVTLYAIAPIKIGDHTMIAINATIHTASHNYQNHPMWIERIDRPVQIGKHVWIGTGAIICSGVRVGDYSVIGAGAVITKHVPEFAVVVGNPARIISYRKNIDVNKEIDDYPLKAFITKGEYFDEDRKTLQKE